VKALGSSVYCISPFEMKMGDESYSHHPIQKVLKGESQPIEKLDGLYSEAILS